MNIYIGIDQSNTITGFGIVVEENGENIYDCSYIDNPFPLKERKNLWNKIAYRNLVKEELKKILSFYECNFIEKEKNIYVTYEMLAIHGTKTNFLYIREAGGLCGVIQDTVYHRWMHSGSMYKQLAHVPACIWKRAVTGYARSVKNDLGIKAEKYDTYKHIERIGQLRKCMVINKKGELEYIDDMGDALCIAIYTQRMRDWMKKEYIIARKGE